MTTPDQSENDRSRDQLLAGEYVLGVLPLDQRRRVEDRIVRDAAFAAMVMRWQENLSSDFDAEYGEERPPKGVYARIEKRVFAQNGFGNELARGGWWNSLLLWRGLSFASIALLVTYASLSTGWIGGPVGGSAPGKQLVAEMSGEGNAFGLRARYDGASGRLQLTPVAATTAERRSLELWLVPGSGEEAISLGILPESGSDTIEVPAGHRKRVENGASFAVSLEPLGGSPTGHRTGPVLAVGKIRDL